MKWVKLFTRHYGVLYSEVAMRAIMPEVKEIMKTTLNEVITIPYNGNACCICREDDWLRFKRELEEYYLNDKVRFEKFLHDVDYYGTKYLSFAENLQEVSIGSARELITLFRDYTVLTWLGYLLNDIVSEKAEKIISSHTDEKSKYLDAIFTPRRKYVTLEFNERINDLKQKGYTDKEVEDLWGDFRWLPCIDIHHEPLLLDHVREQLESYEAKKKDVDFDVIYDLNLSEEELFVIYMARELAIMKDLRDVYRRKAMYSSLGFYAKIGESMGLTRHETSYLLSSEFLKEVDKSEIKRRMGGFIVYYKDGHLSCESDPQRIEEMMKSIEIEEDKDENLVRGVSASNGKASGKAKIIFTPDDLHKVERGDILIAITTGPGYLMAMERSSAIVTDEGGLTSHAAIVSRELEKPCIVGAFTATKVFKDGDMIEADADNGTIRRLK